MRPKRYGGPPTYSCYEGHEHATSEGARACDWNHWAKRSRESGLTTEPLKTFEAPPLLPQSELEFGD